MIQVGYIAKYINLFVGQNEYEQLRKDRNFTEY